MSERPLTVGEIEIASSIFGNISGNNVNYGTIRISSNPIMIKGTAIALKNLVTFESGEYLSDYSLGEFDSRALFIHELAHQWQYSQGINVLTRAPAEFITSGFNPYDYSSVFTGVSFSNLPLEAQARLIEDFYIRAQGYQPVGAATVDQLKSVMPPNLLEAVKALELPSEFEDIPARCFSAGTLIAMADGTQRPIELIKPADTVMSFNAEAENGRGALVPGKVVRLFRNHAPHMLDFHGTRVTPGHAYLCGDGPYEGRFRPLIDIIRDDGAVVKADGTLMRAATGCTVGSRGDAFVDLEVLRLTRHAWS